MGSSPKALIKVIISLEEIIFDKAFVFKSAVLPFLFEPLISTYVFYIFPLRGRTAWFSLFLPCFAEPPAESPSTINSSVPSCLEI